MPLDGSGVYSLPAGNPMPFKLKPLPSSLLNSTFSDLKDALNSRLWKGGGTMTGALTLAGNPSGALDAAPKQYVDLHLPKAGGTLTGALNGTTAAFSGTVSGATATAAGHLVTKAQLDAVAATAGVASFNTRTGAVTLSSSDVTTALGFTPVTNARSITAGTGLTGGGDLTANRSFAFDTTWGDARYAQLASPNFSGTPQVGGQNIWHAGNLNPASYAPLASPNFSGTPAVGGASIWHAGNLNPASYAQLNSSPDFSGRVFGRGATGNNGLGKILVQAGGSPPTMSQGDICFIY